MKIAITGASGFLGSHLEKIILKNGFKIEKISFRNKSDETLLKFFNYNLKKINSCNFIVNCSAVKNPKNKHDKFINEKLPKLIQNHIHKNQLKCKFIHISTLNALFDFLDDDYSVQKRCAEIKLNKKKVLIIRPSLIWDGSGCGDSIIFKKILQIPLPLYFMVKPGNLYRPINPSSFSEFIIEIIKKPKLPEELNVLGDTVISLFDLFKNMALSMNKKTMPISPFFLNWVRFFNFKKTGAIHTLSQQIKNFDRTTDTIYVKNKFFLRFDINSRHTNKQY